MCVCVCACVHVRACVHLEVAGGSSAPFGAYVANALDQIELITCASEAGLAPFAVFEDDLFVGVYSFYLFGMQDYFVTRPGEERERAGVSAVCQLWYTC
jgi:hypothetical protein